MKPKVLITGIPTSGKSTLTQAVVQKYPHRQGFITREMQEDGARAGFEVVTADGKRATLAHINIRSPHQVSKYGVDVPGFERLLPGLASFTPDQLLYIDEIGQMEFFAPGFAALVRRYIDAPNPFIGTISKVFSDDTTKALLADPRIQLIDIDILGRAKALDAALRVFPGADAAVRAG